MTAKERGAAASGPSLGECASVLDATQLAFYKKLSTRLVVVTIINVVVILALGLALVYMVNQAIHGKREYFAVDSATGRMIPMPPLGTPYISEGALLARINECVTKVNTYNYVDWQTRLQDAKQECFTEDGWNQYAAAINRAGTIKLVREGRQVVSANTTGAAVINKQGDRAGKYSWEVQVPMQVTYQGGQAGRNLVSSKQLVTLLIERVPTWQNSSGVGISSYIAEEQ